MLASAFLRRITVKRDFHHKLGSVFAVSCHLLDFF
jgi:hypothetical protein